MDTKAELGAGTLLIFIASLIIAAVAAGVILSTAGFLEEKSLSTGMQARGDISTNIRTLDISATDGLDSTLNDFRSVIKLAPGSEPVRLSQMIFTFHMRDATATLRYRGDNSVCERNNQNGYNTWNIETFDELSVNRNKSLLPGGALDIFGPNAADAHSLGVDLDDDGVLDSMRVCQRAGADYACPGPDASLEINLSTNGLMYVRIENDNGTFADISDQNEAFDFSHLDIGDYGYLKGSRTAGAGPYIISEVDTDLFFEAYGGVPVLDEDLDDDNLDEVLLINNTDAVVQLGSGYEIPVSLGVDLASTTCQAIDIENYALVNETGATLGYMNIDTDCAANKTLPVHSLSITPKKEGEGYYAITYEIRGSSAVEGALTRGDVAHMCYESPANITEHMRVRMFIIPKIGTPTQMEFFTPEVISLYRVFLYH